MFRQLREDIAIVKEKDPAARSSLEILLTYSGLKAVRSVIAHLKARKEILRLCQHPGCEGGQ